MPTDSADGSRRISPDVLVSHLAGEAILLNLRDKRYYRLNETAAFIWKSLERGDSRDAIVAALTAEFAVVDADASAAVDQQLEEFAERGFII